MGVHDLGRGFVTIVDDIDDDLFEGVKWRTLNSNSKTPYVIKSSKTGGILLHRVILERVLGRRLERGEYVDHINGDGLDNRRENLRLATNSQNLANSGIRRDNSSGYKGVDFFKRTGRWRARIMVDRKSIYLGYFDTPDDAAKAYNDAARKYFGEFANLNEIERELD